MNLKRELRKLNKEIKPQTDWLKSNREILLSQIKAQGRPLPEKEGVFGLEWQVVKSIFAPQVLQLAARPVLAGFLIISIVLGSGVFTVSAAMSSVPGNLLYPIKITTENIQLGLASDQDKVKLEVEFAGRRLDELKQTKAQTAEGAVAISKLKTELNSISSRLTTMKTGADDKVEVVKTALLINDKTEDLAAALKQEAPEAKEVIAAAQDVVDRSAGLIIENHGKGETGISEKDVVRKVEDKISGLESKAGAAGSDKTAEVNKVIKEAKTLLQGGDLLSAYNKATDGEKIINTTIEGANTLPAATSTAVNVNVNTNTNINANSNTNTGSTIKGGVIEEKPQKIKGGLIGE